MWIEAATTNHFSPLFFSFILSHSQYSALFTYQSYTISHRSRQSGTDTSCLWPHACWFRLLPKVLVWWLAQRWMYKMVYSWHQWCPYHSCCSPASSSHSMPFQFTYAGSPICRTSVMVSKEPPWPHTHSGAKSWNAIKHIAISVHPKPHCRNWTWSMLALHLTLLP